MDKNETDRALNTWVIKCLGGPMSALSLLAFTVGYWWPQAISGVQPIALAVGLDHFLSMRTAGVEFRSAAYLYWMAFCSTFLIHVWWIHRQAKQSKLHGALFAVARKNLTSGRWNPSKYTMRGGFVRIVLFAVMFFGLFFSQLISVREPSYCAGCESASAFGFLLINWAGMHLFALFGHVMLTYLVLWKSIRANFGD